MSNFGVYLKGDWRKLNALARYLQALPTELEEVIRYEAEQLANEMKEGLRNGTYPLSPAHAESTIRKWGEHPLLYLHGDLADSIEVQEVTLRSGHTNYIVGTSEYADLAELLEYGDDRIPGRHFFTVASDLFYGTFLNQINKVVDKF